MSYVLVDGIDINLLKGNTNIIKKDKLLQSQ
jgi:hypothetical protein